MRTNWKIEREHSTVADVVFTGDGTEALDDVFEKLPNLLKRRKTMDNQTAARAEQ